MINQRSGFSQIIRVFTTSKYDRHVSYKMPSLGNIVIQILQVMAISGDQPLQEV